MFYIFLQEYFNIVTYNAHYRNGQGDGYGYGNGYGDGWGYGNISFYKSLI
jgi:hypothetical protein